MGRNRYSRSRRIMNAIKNDCKSFDCCLRPDDSSDDSVKFIEESIGYSKDAIDSYRKIIAKYPKFARNVQVDGTFTVMQLYHIEKAILRHEYHVYNTKINSMKKQSDQ